jgi:hypothetical protein
MPSVLSLSARIANPESLSSSPARTRAVTASALAAMLSWSTIS